MSDEQTKHPEPPSWSLQVAVYTMVGLKEQTILMQGSTGIDSWKLENIRTLIRPPNEEGVFCWWSWRVQPVPCIYQCRWLDCLNLQVSCLLILTPSQQLCRYKHSLSHATSTTTTRIFTDRTYVIWEKNVICASVRTNFQFDSSQGRSTLLPAHDSKTDNDRSIEKCKADWRNGSLRRFNTTICVANRSCYTYHFYITFFFLIIFLLLILDHVLQL